MKVAALILGIIGGVWGFFIGLGAVVVCGFFEAFGLPEETIMDTGAAIIPLSIVGIAGGILSLVRPRIGGILLLIGSVGLIILTAYVGVASWYIIVSMSLLIVGGILALAASRS